MVTISGKIYVEHEGEKVPPSAIGIVVSAVELCTEDGRCFKGVVRDSNYEVEVEGLNIKLYPYVYIDESRVKAKFLSTDLAHEYDYIITPPMRIPITVHILIPSEAISSAKPPVETPQPQPTPPEKPPKPPAPVPPEKIRVFGTVYTVVNGEYVPIDKVGTRVTTVELCVEHTATCFKGDVVDSRYEIYIPRDILNKWVVPHVYIEGRRVKAYFKWGDKLIERALLPPPILPFREVHMDIVVLAVSPPSPPRLRVEVGVKDCRISVEKVDEVSRKVLVKPETTIFIRLHEVFEILRNKNLLFYYPELVIEMTLRYVTEGYTWGQRWSKWIKLSELSSGELEFTVVPSARPWVYVTDNLVNHKVIIESVKAWLRGRIDKVSIDVDVVKPTCETSTRVELPSMKAVVESAYLWVQTPRGLITYGRIPFEEACHRGVKLVGEVRYTGSLTREDVFNNVELELWRNGVKQWSRRVSDVLSDVNVRFEYRRVIIEGILRICEEKIHRARLAINKVIK